MNGILRCVCTAQHDRCDTITYVKIPAISAGDGITTLAAMTWLVACIHYRRSEISFRS